jgi:drug/metabolite transporter (DMT)-like permease
MYGLGDFIAGLLARRVSVWAVAVVVQLFGAVLIGIVTTVVPGHPLAEDWFWGAISGVGGGIGTVFLYRGLATGQMGVVAPLSAVGAAVLPVLIGLVGGERPSVPAWVGIACAFPAMWLVSSAADPAEPKRIRGRLGIGVSDGLLAGIGFGILFAALGQVSDTAGLGPPALGQGLSVITVAVIAAVMRRPWIPRSRSAWPAVLVGFLAGGAAVLFLYATQAGMLAIASILTSLYPAVTVLLAAVVLRERIHRGQAVGLALAAVAVTLVAVG